MEKRLNIFERIHNTISRSLGNSLMGLRNNDFENRTATTRVLEQAKGVLEMYDDQLSIQAEHVLPLVLELDPHLHIELEASSKIRKSRIRRLINLIGLYDQAVSGRQKLEAGEVICTAFAEFVPPGCAGLQSDDLKLNNFLWTRFSDDDIRNLHRSMLSGMLPAELWFQDAFTRSSCVRKMYSEQELNAACLHSCAASPQKTCLQPI